MSADSRVVFVVPAVGFRLMEHVVGEATPTVYSCVEIVSSNGPLTSNVVIEFHTQDGSANGKPALSLQYLG